MTKFTVVTGTSIISNVCPTCLRDYSVGIAVFTIQELGGTYCSEVCANKAIDEENKLEERIGRRRYSTVPG